MLYDLRESGQIEQYADLIAFLFRDDYYNRDCEEDNLVEVILAKQRNGPIGTVKLAFHKEYGSLKSSQGLHLRFRHFPASNSRYDEIYDFKRSLSEKQVSERLLNI
ncbi:hypothetical protein D0466_04030 [Peribacillus glennii]|uniref:SF4 helicase domain-containing protein n=1 Tax=Peribacillus glennii TaxID=2303991 RepID=A0A372LID6_9BACI|nr:hypothetical protein D0466_04030 [Peribacillus glennii]